MKKASPPNGWTEKAPYGALALDLDGTTLSPRSRLEDHVVSLLREAAEAFPVCFITGRMEASAAGFWRQAGLKTPLVSYNGARIGVPGQPPMFQASLPREAVHRVHEVARRNDWHTNFYVEDRLLVLREGSRARWYAEQFRVPCRVAGESELLDGPLPTKMLMIVPREELGRAEDELRRACPPELATFTASSEIFIEALPPGCDKGSALARMAEWLEIPLERWVAVGDAPNDTPMLAAAGLGVAVAGGHAEVAARADWVSPPLWLGGLAELLSAAFHLATPDPSYGQAFLGWMRGP